MHGFINNAGGGKDRNAVTLVVAASDSSALSKASADYVCPGTDDLDYITTTVIPVLPVGGGRIVLMEGTYYCDTNAKPLYINGKTGITIEGQGYSTLLKFLTGNESGNIIHINASSYIEIKNLKINGTTTANDGGSDLNQCGILTVASSFCKIHDNIITGCKRHGISHQTSGNDNEWNENTVYSNVRNGMYINAGQDHQINFNDVYTNGYNGIRVNSGYIKIIGNFTEENTQSGMYIDGGNDYIITNNHSHQNTQNGFYLNQLNDSQFQANTAFTNGYRDYAVMGSPTRTTIIGNFSYNSGVDGFLLTGMTYCIVQGNNIYGAVNWGIYVDGGNHNIISGNKIDSCKYDGLILSGSSNNIVNGNLCSRNSQQTDDTYDGIKIDANSDGNNVQTNTVRHGGGAKQHKYGINIANANCDNNLCTNNDLLTSGKTASLNDTGTGTITIAGNRL